MNDAQIKEQLRDRNPWWREPTSWSDKDYDLREAADAPFVYAPVALANIVPPNLYTLIGPRRVGKSVVLKQKIQEIIVQGVSPRQIIYCSCDGFRLQDLRRMFKAGRAMTPGLDEDARWWFIDEITSIGDGWSEIIKELRDNTSLRHDCVNLTGSSSRGFRNALEHLAGRRGPDSANSDQLLLPMGFRQFCTLTAVDLPTDIQSLPLTQLFSRQARESLNELAYWTEPLIDAWENYLRIGGYPRAVAEYIENGDVSEGFVRDLWDVIRGDAIRNANLPDATILSFLEQLGQGLASPSNVANLSQRLDIGSGPTVAARIDDLVTNFLAWKCPQIKNQAPNDAAQKKVYFTDPLIARIAALVDNHRNEPEISKLSEQQIGMAIARSIDRRSPGSFVLATRLMYYRAKTNKEIDFVGPDFIGCIEGKYSDTGWRREAQTARANYSNAILASRREHELPNDGIWVTPAPALVWLLEP
jgi:predicted AAA+ superfamily ATPase